MTAQSIVTTEAAQAIEAQSSPEPQANSANEPLSVPKIEPQTANLESTTPEGAVPNIRSIPSPPAIDFVDKQP